MLSQIKILSVQFAFLAIVSFSTSAAATENRDDAFFIELNKSTNTDEGKCQTVFLSKNGLQQKIEILKIRFAVLDSQGVFLTMLSLPPKKMESSSRYVERFSIPTLCSEISEIIVNEFSACKIDSESTENKCEINVIISARSSIAFGF